MQTEAEKYLISLLRKKLIETKFKLKLINLGAAKSTVIEKSLLEIASASEHDSFICDRADIEDCQIDDFYVQNSYIAPLENLEKIPDANYDLAFANFVLEHINNPGKAASEMARILKPNSELILSMSNPMAPEFIIASFTPTSLHQLFRKEDQDKAYPVKYSYQTIPNFIKIMNQAGWVLKEECRFPAVYTYLYRFPYISSLAKFYDNMLISLNLKSLQGHVVLHFINQNKKTVKIDK